MRDRANAVHYTPEADTFTFFHDDGPVKVSGSEVVTAYMDARQVVEAWRDGGDLTEALEQLAEGLSP